MRREPRRSGDVSGDDRAISEVLSYAFIFGMVLLAVAIVTVGGFATLDSVRSAEQANNAERAFDVLHDNLDSVHSGGAPSRATEISIGQSELFLGDPVTVNVTVVNTTGHAINTSRQVRPISYRTGDDTSLVYENGAVFRDQRDSGVMLREPPQLFGGERTIVPIVRTWNENVESVGGQNVLVRGEATTRRIPYSDSNGAVDRVVLNITSPRHDIWERYYEDELGASCADPALENNMRCTITGTDSVHVTVQEMEITLVT